MLGRIHASNSLSIFLIATSVFVPAAPSSVRPHTRQCRQQSVETDAAFWSICLQLSMIYVDCLELEDKIMSNWWGSQARNNTGSAKRRSDRKRWSPRPNHLVPHHQDPEPQIPLEVEILSPLVLGRPPNHEFSEHKSGKIVSLCDKI